MLELDGIITRVENIRGFEVETVDILTDAATKIMDKEIGSYVTIQTEEPLDALSGFEKIGECLAQVLERVLRPCFHGRLCICGLGNRNVPSDALGPEVTSDLPLKYFPLFSNTKNNFSDVYSFTPGVTWANNVPTETLVAAAVEATKADCVLLVDSIATEDHDRLYKAIEISTAGGTSPYCGGHHVDWSVLGRPVISIGVPTAIPAEALFPSCSPRGELLTSTKIAEVISAAGTIIAYAIIRVCWPALSSEDCFLFTKMEKDPFYIYADLGRKTRDLLQNSPPPAAGVQ